MKKLIFVALMLFTMSANAVVLKTKTLCVGGYKYLVVYSPSSVDSGPSVVQMMKQVDVLYPPQLIKCKK